MVYFRLLPLQQNAAALSQSQWYWLWSVLLCLSAGSAALAEHPLLHAQSCRPSWGPSALSGAPWWCAECLRRSSAVAWAPPEGRRAHRVCVVHLCRRQYCAAPDPPHGPVCASNAVSHSHTEPLRESRGRKKYSRFIDKSTGVRS